MSYSVISSLACSLCISPFTPLPLSQLWFEWTTNFFFFFLIQVFTFIHDIDITFFLIRFYFTFLMYIFSFLFSFLLCIQGRMLVNTYSVNVYVLEMDFFPSCFMHSIYCSSPSAARFIKSGMVDFLSWFFFLVASILLRITCSKQHRIRGITVNQPITDL